MKNFEENQSVQVLRNVGNLGLCWLEAKYIQTEGNCHRVRTTGGDIEEIFSVDDDCIASEAT